MILRFVGIMALGMSLAVSAHAGRGINRATGQAIWDAAVNGRTTTIGGGNGSMQVIRPTTTGTPVRGSGGGVAVTDTMPVPVGGVAVPVSATTNVSKTDIAAAVVGCATGTVVGCAVAAIPLAVAWMSLSGTRVNPDSGGLERADPLACNANCFYYAHTGDIAKQYTSQANACAAWINEVLRKNYPSLTITGGQGANDLSCAYVGKTSSGEVLISSNTYPALVRGGARPPDSGTWYPATPQEVKDALYNNDPPPAIIDELSKYGNIIWPGPSSVTGPASVTGPKTTSISTAGNQSSTTTSQATTPLTYQGSAVTAGNPTTTSSTTTTTTNPDGSTSTSSSSTTTTTEAGSATPAETPSEEAAPSDTPLPAVPDLYTRKYPNGMEGIWGEYKDQLKGTSLVSLVGKLMPNVGSGGSCPSWMLNLDLAQWASFGTHDVAPPCWIWDVAKSILILSALLLARSLIFGG